jgi:hypothetical protein
MSGSKSFITKANFFWSLTNSLYFSKGSQKLFPLLSYSYLSLIELILSLNMDEHFVYVQELNINPI